MAKYIVEMQMDKQEKFYFIRENESGDIVYLPSKYLMHKKRSKISPNTIQRSAFALSYYLNFLDEKQLCLDDIYQMKYIEQHEHFTDFLIWLKAGMHSREDYLKLPNNETCNAYLKEVFRFYTFMEQENKHSESLKVLSDTQMIVRNSIGIRKVLNRKSFRGYLKEKGHQGKTIEQDKIVVLLQECANSRDQVLLLLLAETGFRIGELLGVRYSITNPDAYIESNLIGFYNILEACRHSYDEGREGVKHLVYASSSSVYGSNKKVPYSTDDKVDNPVSLYAATKKSNELMAHAYSKLYDIPSTGLRFFTVYGPAGRPDMAYFGFTDKLLRGERIKIFNYGNCKRDFTYVDDIVEGVMRVMAKAPERKVGEDGLPVPPYKVYNIGNNHPENLLDFVQILQEELIRAGVLPADYDFEAHKELVPMQLGDVSVTYADTSALERDFGFKPSTPLREGLRKFAGWYKDFYME